MLSDCAVKNEGSSVQTCDSEIETFMTGLRAVMIVHHNVANLPDCQTLILFHSFDCV